MTDKLSIEKFIPGFRKAKEKEKQTEEVKQEGSQVSVMKIFVNLMDSENEKMKQHIDQTAERLIKKGEEYRKKKIVLQKKRAQREVEECSFTPDIKKYHTSTPRQEGQREVSSLNKSLNKTCSQNFIEKNKKNVSKHQKKRA